jgi:hypothetical protein
MKTLNATGIACLVLLLGFAPVLSARGEPAIQISPLEEGSIRFSFDNAHFTSHDGQRAFSVDVSATTASWLLSKDVSFANLELLFYAKDQRALIASFARPILLNSHNLGRIIRMSPSGPILMAKDTTIPAAIKGVNLPKGGTHGGVLLFSIPDDAVFIHGLRYYEGSSTIRAVPSQHISMESLDQDTVWRAISSIGIPTQVHMRLLDIHLAMQAFDVLNDSLRGVW